MSRAWNFSAGPAALPGAVLERARDELLDWQGMGCSVMEISHRSKPFLEVVDRAERDLRVLLGLGDDYHVLYLHGGASLQFAAVPLNLSEPGETGAYIHSGHWAERAISEAGRYVNAHVAADAGEPYNNLPDPATWDIPDNARYLHYTPNETIGGVEFHFVPETGDIPLVADMSSCILSRPIDCSRFGVIYAGAQKNIGPAGLCLVIVRKDLLGRARATTPSLMNWTLARDNDSMLNTPPTYAWYLAGLVYQWLLEQGGLAVMAERNSKKADTLYEFIDSSDFYSNPVVPEVRSRMNVPFTLADDRLDAVFLKSAEEHRLLHLKGHRAVGGMRASIYNAVPQQAVDDLVSFMSDFEQKYG